MRVTLAADHAGFELKQFLLEHVRSLGHEVIDAGANSTAPSDYPDFAEAVAKHVLNGDSERGILICGSGVGASVAVNKIPGIRGGLCHDEYSAHQGVEHDNMNVLVLGSRVIGTELARELVTRFLAAQFSNGERHVRRLAKVAAIERKYSRI
jgi:ribose 5-phosphate isomerase B